MGNCTLACKKFESNSDYEEIKCSSDKDSIENSQKLHVKASTNSPHCCNIFPASHEAKSTITPFDLQEKFRNNKDVSLKNKSNPIRK